MSVPDEGHVDRVPLSRSQQNLYNGVLQDADPALYLIGKTYRFHPLKLSEFLAALRATMLENPVQLCVLEMPATASENVIVYPDLLLRLQFDDIVRVRPDDEDRSDHGDDELNRTWYSGILDKPLARYTVWTDTSGDVVGLDAYSHHILVDGGATGIIEDCLARYLAAGSTTEDRRVTDGLARLRAAHLREQAKVEESLQRLAAVVQRELAEDARLGAYGQGSNGVPGSAAKGVLRESVTISGSAFDAVLALSEAKQVPLNVLVTAAAVAVDASIRKSTESLLVHAVDNRFGDPGLNVATCLVNSVAHSGRFSPFASVQDVVRTLDRSYVKAVRRRWLREEHYRRMYLAINRTSHIEALTLNFIREACAPALRPFLVEAPVATDIGPVEGMTVASVLDEEQRTLNLSIWDRADLPERKANPGVGARIAAALGSMAALWDQPIAMTVDEWLEVGPDGTPAQGDAAIQTARPAAPAWFLDAAGGVQQILESRPYVYPWVAWLVSSGAVPGDVVVVADDNTDRTIDLLIACHLAGCGYSVCNTPDDISLRAGAIGDHIDDVSVHVVDIAAAGLGDVVDDARNLADRRIELVTQDPCWPPRRPTSCRPQGRRGNPSWYASHTSRWRFSVAQSDRPTDGGRTTPSSSARR